MYSSVRKEFTQAQTLEKRNEVKADPNRLSYHLMPPVGWLNDPNGLSEMNGVYHIFYQYTPANPLGNDHRGWGHYQTKDFIHYQEMDDPFVPDTHGDGKGSYSGSALIRDGVMHLFFTGNNKLPGDYDYINNGRIHWVLHSQSKDGVHFTPKEVLLRNEDYPDYLSCHVRDPKIYTENGQDYMVLGARTKDSKGQVEVFKGDGTLKNWIPCSTITPKESFGYMWECPDLFDLDEHLILITCPQGVPTQGILYENIYQNGWFEVNHDLEHDQQVDQFHELDNGFDFYAPQSFLDEKGRRILVGWMGIPEADYDNNPTIEKNWQHALTLPRQLTWKDGTIYQMPIQEIEALRQEELSIRLEANQCMEFPTRVLECNLIVPANTSFHLTFREDVELDYNQETKVFSLILGKSGHGRDARHVEIASLENIRIYSDTSSLEIFLNDGQKALTTRLFDDALQPKLCTNVPLTGTAYSLGSFVIEEKLEKENPQVQE